LISSSAGISEEMPSSRRTAFAFFAKLFQLQNLSPADFGSAGGFGGEASDSSNNSDPDLCEKEKP
jgi:hypothetical protein